MRAIREQRGWNQGKFAEELGKPQSVTSRLENPDYGRLSLKTLLEVASTFDVALIVRFVSFPEFLRQTRDVSVGALQVDKFSDADFISTDSDDRVIVDTVTDDGLSTHVIGKLITGPTKVDVQRLSVTVH